MPLLVANSEVIVRGTVESIVALNPGDSYSRYHLVTANTRSILAGDIGERWCFVTAAEQPYIKLKKSGDEGLFFLTSSQRDFNRKTPGYFYSRCPWIANLVSVDAGDTSLASFNATEFFEVKGRQAILTEAKRCLESTPRDRQLPHFVFSDDPDQKEFSGFGTSVTVPLNQELYSLSKLWSAGDGPNTRHARRILSNLIEPIEFESAKVKHAAEQQVPTEWRKASSLNIDSIEWMAADCDVIVKGVIEELALVQLGEAKNTEYYDKTLDRHLVKLRVTQQLKGTVEDTISFVLENGGKLSEWQERKVPVLLFLKDRMLPIQNSSGRNLIIRDEIPIRYVGRGTDTNAIIAFEAGHPKVFSSRLTWTEDPTELLVVLQEYLTFLRSVETRQDQRPTSFSFRPPERYLEGTAWEGDSYVRMYFPIDGYLERCAKQWIISDRKEDRWLGAYSLVYFKSDENAAALQRLLGDPGKWAKPISVSIYSQQKVEYLVRWEAWKVLDAWGYDVPAPSFSDN